MSESASNPPVKVFTKENCRHCVSAKSLLTRLGVPYAEVDLSGDVDAQVNLARRTGYMTLPQIQVGETVIGGFTDLESVLSQGGVASLYAVA